MKLVKKDIETWIKPYTTVIGNSMSSVDINLKEANSSKYFIQCTLPNNFESYAIALHPFTIRGELPKGTSENFLEEITKVKYTRTSWVELYKLKEATFDLNTAILDTSNRATNLPLSNNVFFPSEGFMDETYFESLINTVIKFYGDQEIEAFYVFLATTNHTENLLFEGKISELPKLLENETDVIGSPSLLYAKDKSWVVNTDYDLPFSTIAGETKFIQELAQLHKGEIIEISY